MNDLKFAFRQLLKNPGFTTVVILTLALGIGANTSIFSVVNLVLLRPLPFESAGQLVRLYETKPSVGILRGPIARPNFNDWRAQAGSFESLSAFNDASFNLTGSGNAERLEATRVSANLFSLLRVHPILGRTFSAVQEPDGRVVVLSYGLWQRRFGGSAEAVNKTITLDNESYSIIGIMPKDFKFPQQPDLWVPLKFTDSEATSRGSRFLRAIGRLKPGIEVRQAQAEMHTIGTRLDQQFGDNQGWDIEVVPMHEDIVGNSRPALVLLSAGIAFVLLIGCANLASLLLAKSAARQREMAVRISLGASRGKLVCQLLTESLLLSSCGGALGSTLAFWGVKALGGLIPSSLPRLEGSGLDGRVLTFALFISILTGILFGLLPALQLSRANLNLSLKAASQNTFGSRNRWLDFPSFSKRLWR